MTEAVAGGASVKAVGQGGRDGGEGRQEVYDLPHALLMLQGAAPCVLAGQRRVRGEQLA